MSSFVGQLIDTIRIADILDIAVIGLLIYCVLVWFRDRASRSVLVITAILVTVFLGAHWLDMYLTTMLIRAGVFAAVLVFVVIFQQDIRRSFERLSSARWLRSLPETMSDDRIDDTLAEAISMMAAQRIGALLVFAGHEPIEQHVRGGLDVEGRISMPLLYSIFHPQSPGHDGAVLIEAERIARLGVHLPLSDNQEAIGHRGTRHAAALGLAERCDAMVVVVSEERESISLAQHGQLTEIEPNQLIDYLRRWSQDRSPTAPHLATSWTADVGWKVGSFLLACLAWFIFAYRVETIQRTFIVPIEYRNLSDQWVVEEPRATKAELTLTGSERAFNVLDPTALAVSLDLGRVRLNTPILVETEDGLKNVPDALTVNQIQPRELLIIVGKKQAPTPAVKDR